MLDLEVRLTSDVRTYSSLLQMLELRVVPLQMFELKVRYFKCRVMGMYDNTVGVPLYCV